MLFVNSFLPVIGGRELVVHYLARSLAALGHNVRVICIGRWRQYSKLDYGYPVYRYPTLRGLFPESVRFTHLLIDVMMHGCDVIHAHATYPSGFIAARFKKIKKIPLVITPHGIDIHTIPELGHGLRLKPDLDSRIRYSLQHSELLTAISTSVVTSLVDAGAVKGKIREIPNGVDIQRFEKDPGGDVYEWLDIASDTKLIVTVGRYNPRKGQDVIIKSLPIILEKEPKTKLVIVGEKTDPLRPLISDLDLNDKVILTGGINPPANTMTGVKLDSRRDAEDWLAALYQKSKVYISAGIGEGAEGLSLAVLESMAAGLPVVATDISGNRDIVKDSLNGFLVKPADHASLAEGILKIIGSDTMQERMSIASKKIANQYSWDEIARQYLNVYEEAIYLMRK